MYNLEDTNSGRFRRAFLIGLILPGRPGFVVDEHLDELEQLAESAGLIARYFPDPEERQKFLRSAEYEQLNELLRSSIRRKGLYPRPAGGKNASAR